MSYKKKRGLKEFFKRSIVYLIVLSFVLGMCPATVQVEAATTIKYSDAKVEFGYSAGVSVGTIRYVQQNDGSVNQGSGTYWYGGKYWGNYSNIAYQRCNAAACSMALSYIGLNVTPAKYLENGNSTYSNLGQTKTLEYGTNVSAGINQFIKGNGKYSPVVLQMTPYPSSGGEHWVILVGRVSNNTYRAIDPWNSNNSPYKNITINGTTCTIPGKGTATLYKTYQFYCGTTPISSNLPVGNVDEVTGKEESVYVRGWTYDADNLNSSVRVDVYVGGDYKTGKGTSIYAKKERPDVPKNLNKAVGNYHGFDATVSSFGLTGNQEVNIYAIDNVGGNGNKNTLLGTYTVNISKKVSTCSKPSISTSDIVGGKTLKISGGSSDTIHYTVKKDGAAYLSGTATGSYSATLDTAGTYSVSAYSSRSGYTNSGSATKSTTVTQAATPKIGQSVTEDSVLLNMSTDTSGAAIYYTTSGNTPTVSSSKYTGPVSVSKDKTIKAIAVKSGCANSEVGITTVKLEAPEAPTAFTLESNEKIPTGENVTVKWDKNSMATGYTVSLYKDDEKVDSMSTSGSQATFNLPEAGEYQIKIYASNFVGNSEEAETVLSVEAMDPVTVSFVDWDGSVIKKQEVTYGKDAALPEDPSRKGYTFISWENAEKITGVTENLTVTATYKINTYTVRFYDASGSQVGSTQKIEYGKSATSPESELTDIPTGYVFAGWKVTESSNDSQCDYKEVDSDLKLQAVYCWENDELPVVAEITQATRNTETGNYNVEVKLTNYPTQATTAILRVSLMTSEGKMVKSGKEEIEIGADETITESMTLKYSGIATKASVVVLGLNGDSLTGSANSKIAEQTITEQSDTTWSSWSDWSTTEQTASDDVEVETKTEYRYADKSTTTSSSSSMSGWTKYNTTSSWNAYGSWSGWSDTAQTASDSKQVETRTEWRYYCFYCPVCGGREPLQGTSDCHKYSLTLANAVTAWFPTAYKNSSSKAYSYTTAKRYTESLGDGKRWNFTASNLNDTAVGTKDGNSSSGAVVIRKAYRYRTRTKTTTYYYYKWSDWSDWSDTEYTSSDTRKVETRTVYRSREKVPVYSELAGTEETGKSYSFSGKLAVDADLNGKIATIMVYKGKNTDPNEDQIQYVGQTTLGEDNSYSFTVTPKAEPTELSGDYTVCLGVEGATGLINVDIIKAPKPSYTVKYVDTDGTELSSQTIDEGENAEVPESPTKTGYIFTGWSANAVNVQENLLITATYEPRQYVVAFVDAVNDVVSFENYQYGETITPPEDPSAEGKEFVGWDCIIDGKDTVTENMIAKAVYKSKSYTVEFVDENDETIDSQTIEYGQSATPPAALDVEGKEFLGWSTSTEWWNVKEDMTVKPILIYLETASAPTLYCEESDDYLTVYMESETEDADIYYTLDGSEPTTDSEKYEGLLIVDDYDIECDDEGPTARIYTANIKAFAVASEMNDSEVVPVTFTNSVEIEPEVSMQVTLDVNGGTEMEENVLTVFQNCCYGELPDAVREGYVFKGWYTAQKGGTKVEVETLVEKAEDHTLYAHWKKEGIADNDISEDYTITCDTAVYTGKALEPEVKVVNDDTEEVLVKDTDYTVAYSDNVNAGTGKAVITGTGDYTGEQEISFTIEKAEQSVKISVPQTTLAVGKNMTFSVEAQGEITYTSSNDDVVMVSKSGKVVAVEAGEATITVNAAETDNYESASRNIEITVEEEDPCTDGHDTEIINALEAGCETEGYTGDTHCKTCGKIISEGETIEAKGHSWDEGVVTKEATETEAGEKTFTCSVCNATKQESIPATGDTDTPHTHDYVRTVKEKATCTENGLIEYECSGCGDSYTIEVEALGHAGGSATCSTKAICTRCQTAYGSYDDSKHSSKTETKNKVEATCKEEGYSGDICCKDCGKIITYGKETSKADHTWDAGTVTKAATATAAGEKTFTCTVCNATKKETIPATGSVHTHSYKTVVTKATFTTDGKIEEKCSCGNVKSTKKIAKASKIYLQRKQTYSGDWEFSGARVLDSEGDFLPWDDYDNVDSGGIKVGTYKVTIKLKGNYTGTKTLTYDIVPKGTIITNLTAGKKSFSVKLKKQEKQTTGYEIQYAKKKNFAGAKTLRIINNKKTSCKVKKLSKKKKYYVRIRTYKKIGKKYYYSNWSKTKTVKTK